jgi:hypothetical protein
MAVGTIGVIGRLGAKAAVGTVKLGGRAAKATGKAAVTSAKATPGAVGRAAVNVPTNLAKTFWNAQVQDLGLSSLTIRSGPLLRPKPPVDTNEDGTPKVKRKRKPDTDKPSVEPKGIGRGAAQIVAALKPLTAIEATLDGLDGSLAGLRTDIQGLSAANAKGFDNVINTLKTLLPNAFDNLRNQRSHRDKSGAGGGTGKERKGILESLGGLPSLLNKIFGSAGLVATAIGAIAKLGRGVGRSVASVSRGVVRAGRGLGNAARETIRGRSNSVRATARAIGAGEAIPEVVRPVEAPRATETVRPNEAPRANVTETARPVEAPRATETARPVEAPRAGEPVVDPAKPVEAPRATETVRPTETARPLVPDADGLAHDSNRINLDEPSGRVEPPKPTVEPPKPSVAEVIKATEVPAINAADPTPELKPTETVKPVEPEAPKPTLKPDAEVKATEGAKPKANVRGSALSKALGRAFIGGALILETVQGAEEWSEAYDKYLAGELTPKEYRKITLSIVGKAAGSFTGGLALGALAGGVAGLASGPGAPVVSTITGLIGGAAGGIVGAYHGAALGEKVGTKVADALIGPIDDEDKKLAPRPNGTTPTTPAIPSASTVGVPTASTIASPTTTQATPPLASVQANTPTVAAANQMIANSNQVAAQARAAQTPPIIVAPQTNNTTNNSVSGGSGSGRPTVGNPRADLSPLDMANLGSRIGNVPGQNF